VTTSRSLISSGFLPRSDASVSRVFRLRGRLSAEARLAATNVLNTVTFATINTVISSPQFALPTIANPMRRLQATIRVRF